MPDKRDFREKLNETIIAVVVEGGAEAAILNILIDHGLLFFDRSQMFNREVLCERSATKIENKLKGFSFGSQKVSILRILDSKSEKYTPGSWGKAYLKDEQGELRVFEIITSPEIEMLFVHAEGAYREYLSFVEKRHRKSNSDKPSIFCKEELFTDSKNRYSKSRSFAERYFQNPDRLVNAILDYHRKNGDKDHLDLSDLLK